MGEENMKSEVGEAVANGAMSPTKSNNDVREKKDEKDNEASKDEEKVKNEEVNADHKDTEEREVTDSKEEGEGERKKEDTSDLMEVDDVDDANGQNDVRVAKIVGSQKDATKKSGGEKSKNKKATEEKNKHDEPKTPVGSAIDRPVRERKSVERLVAILEQDSAKEFHIEKGRGTALKDIPNVAYKLSKKKVADDTLKLLHTVLFVRRGKASEIKSHILRFSGFVWHENEDRQKTKVHEKLDKFNKEKLFEFCDLFDIPVTKTTAKKEDVIAKLIDFLLEPHATSSVLLAEKEQSSKGNKRKRVNKKSASTSEATPSKDSSKKSKSASKEQKGTSDTEESEDEQEDGSNEHQNVNGGPAKSESEEQVEPESVKEDSKKRKRDTTKPPSKTESASKSKSKKEATPKNSNPQRKTPTQSSTIQSKSKDLSDSKPLTKTFSRKKKTDVVDEKTSTAKRSASVVDEKTSTAKKSASKEKTVKNDVKEKEKPKEEVRKPSDDELTAAVCEILKEADFKTVTFNDILKLLNERFNTDLTARKATAKSIVKAELARLAEEDGDDETEAEKTGKRASV